MINCAGLTNVDGCEKYPDEAFLVNAEAPAVLAQICQEKNARLIHISTDYVFDGREIAALPRNRRSQTDSAFTAQSKLEGELRVLAVSANHLVVRVSWVFGPDRPSFVDWVIDQASRSRHGLRRGRQIFHADLHARPGGTVAAALSIERGARRDSYRQHRRMQLVRVSDNGRWIVVTPPACRCARAKLNAISLSDMKNFVARRPRYSVLSTAKYEELTHRTPRDWHDAVADYVERFYAKV